MPDEIKGTSTQTTESVESPAENTAVEVENDLPKTQEELNKLLETRVMRERKRAEKKYANYDGMKSVYDALVQNGVASGIITDDIEKIKSFYGERRGTEQSTNEAAPAAKSETKAVLPKEERIVIAEISAQRFADSKTAEEIEDECQDLREKGKKRTDEEDVRLFTLEKHLQKISLENGRKKQISDFRSKYPKVSVDDLAKDEKFMKFVRNTKAPLTEAYELYLEMSGTPKQAKVPLGTVATKGEPAAGEYPTMDEIKAMPLSDVQKNLKYYEDAIAYWSKKKKT